MYHIHQDKRQIATANSIRDGLTKCLLSKKMTEVTVSDIAEAAGVSRSTFYRSFDIPIDVLSYSCDKLISEIINDHSSVDYADREAFTLFVLRYWGRRSELLEAAVNCDRIDIVYKSLMSYSDNFIDDIKSEIWNDFTETELDYVRSGIVGLVTNLLHVWIQHGKKETPEELFELYKKVYSVSTLIRNR